MSIIEKKKCSLLFFFFFFEKRTSLDETREIGQCENSLPLAAKSTYYSKRGCFQLKSDATNLKDSFCRAALPLFVFLFFFFKISILAS